MMTHNSLVKIKEHPPYSKELEGPVLLNSLARASLDKKTNSYVFTDKMETQHKPNVANVKAVQESLKAAVGTSGVGVDQGSWLIILALRVIVVDTMFSPLQS